MAEELDRRLEPPRHIQDLKLGLPLLVEKIVENPEIRPLPPFHLHKVGNPPFRPGALGFEDKAQRGGEIPEGKIEKVLEMMEAILGVRRRLSPYLTPHLAGTGGKETEGEKEG
jgi:hypothetical protein